MYLIWISLFAGESTNYHNENQKIHFNIANKTKNDCGKWAKKTFVYNISTTSGRERTENSKGKCR